jgi:hypothetical protein
MTITEQLAEWQIRRNERIAILCPEGQPTPSQIAIAESEADEAIKRLNDPDAKIGQRTMF